MFHGWKSLPKSGKRPGRFSRVVPLCPLGAFCSFPSHRNFKERPEPHRFLKIPIPSRPAALLKSTDSGGAFSAGKLFSAAKRESCSRKHSLLFALCKYLLPARGQNIERAAVKRGKDGFISVGIVHEAKIPTCSISCTTSDYATCVHFDATRGHSGKRAYNPCF